MKVELSNQPKKFLFVWRGQNAQDTYVRGETYSDSAAQLKGDLLRQGIVVKSIRKRSKRFAFLSQNKKIKTSEITVFCRQFSTMIASGIPVVETLEALASDHENPAMQKLIYTVKSDVAEGLSLSDAFSNQKKYFDDLFCNLVRVGEQTGSLVTILNNLAHYKEKSESLKKKVKKALYYPVSVIALALVVATVLLVFVIPQFDSLFKSFGAELPAFTRLVLAISSYMQRFWYIVLLAIVAIILAMREARKRSLRFRYITDELILKLPIVGAIFQYAAVARITSTMSIAYSAGIPLVELLDSLSSVAGNQVYVHAILQLRDSVALGEPLNKSMQVLNLFPSMMVQLVAVGESTGALDKMLNKVSAYYEEEVDTMVEGLSSLLEPLVIAVLGVIIGGFVIAMYMPIFKLGGVV